MSVKVRAMFRCEVEKKTAAGVEYEFTAVTGGSEEAETFFKWTPYGELKMGTMKDSYFEPGKEYYLDFTPVEN